MPRYTVKVEFIIDRESPISAWFVIQRVLASLSLPDSIKSMIIRHPELTTSDDSR